MMAIIWILFIVSLMWIAHRVLIQKRFLFWDWNAYDWQDPETLEWHTHEPGYSEEFRYWREHNQL